MSEEREDQLYYTIINNETEFMDHFFASMAQDYHLNDIVQVELAEEYVIAGLIDMRVKSNTGNYTEEKIKLNKIEEWVDIFLKRDL